MTKTTPLALAAASLLLLGACQSDGGSSSMATASTQPAATASAGDCEGADFTMDFYNPNGFVHAIGVDVAADQAHRCGSDSVWDADFQVTEQGFEVDVLFRNGVFRRTMVRQGDGTYRDVWRNGANSMVADADALDGIAAPGE